MAKIYKCRNCHTELEYCHSRNCWQYQCECDTNWISVDSTARIKQAVYVVGHLIKSEEYSKPGDIWWKD